MSLRAFMPIASLAIGTWLGLDQPDLDVMIDAARKLKVELAGDPKVAPPQPRGPILLDRVPDTIEVRALGQLVPEPLPRLNPEARTTRAWLLAEGPFYPPNENKHLVTFTFDDGPFPETTPKILDLLEWNHVRAAFFFIGKYLDGDDARAAATREVARRAATAGHIIGNHTFDHKHLTELSRPRALAEIDDGSAAIERVTGQRPTFFRPPYGDLSRYLERTLAERENEVVLWSIEAEDMLQDDPDHIFEEMRRRIDYAGGGIILLHDVRPNSVHAFAKVLHWLNENRYDPQKPTVRGYQVVDLEQYIRATAASPQPFANRQALEEARKAAWMHTHPSQKPPAPPAVSGAPRADVVL